VATGLPVTVQASAAASVERIARCIMWIIRVAVSGKIEIEAIEGAGYCLDWCRVSMQEEVLEREDILYREYSGFERHVLTVNSGRGLRFNHRGYGYQFRGISKSTYKTKSYNAPL